MDPFEEYIYRSLANYTTISLADKKAVIDDLQRFTTSRITDLFYIFYVKPTINEYDLLDTYESLFGDRKEYETVRNAIITFVLLYGFREITNTHESVIETMIDSSLLELFEIFYKKIIKK